MLPNGPEFGQLIVRCSQLRLGPVCGQVRISDRLIELARREVVPLAFDPVVKMVAGCQWRLQEIAAEEFADEQRRDVALPRRRIASGPLAGRRQRP